MGRPELPSPGAPADVGDENGGQEGDPAPLLGVILCCTSIPPEQRDSLADAAKEMGAAAKLDLTSDVTHLIVGDTNTPKYKYVARDRQDIRVLSPTWLHAVREAWLAGHDVDLDEFDRQHKLPTFYNLRICVTGFENLQERNVLTEAIEANGAEYHGDLTREVTHLVAAAPKGKKYEYAGQWGIRIVSVEWVQQSLQRGMVLDESLFNPMLPREERGKGAVAERTRPSPVLGKRARSMGSKPEETGRRKLRRTTSTKLESQTGDIWADIGSGETASAAVAGAEWDDSTGVRRDLPVKSEGGERTMGALGHPNAAGDSALGPSLPLGPFCGERICIKGFEDRQTSILLDTLLAGGAEVVDWDQAAQKGITVLVPHATDVSLLDEVRSRPAHCVVSEFWVERCIHMKKKEAKDLTICQPLGRVPIDGFDKISVCPTSFSGIDLLQFSKAMKLMGARYREILSRDTSVLVCGPGQPTKQKLEYALANGIPIVRSAWAWECIRKHRLEDMNRFKPEVLRSSAVEREKKTRPLEQADPGSRALREMTPNANSQPRRQSSPRSDSESLEAALQKSRRKVEVAAAAETDEVEERTERMKDAIEQLQRHKREASTVNETSAGLRERRRRRQLGRVQSNPSSLGGRTASASEAATSFLNVDEEDELARQTKDDSGASGFRPSQTLTYEHEESAAARVQFMKQIASGHERCSAIDSEGMRVESIGTVKDTHKNAGGSTRKMTRRR